MNRKVLNQVLRFIPAASLVLFGLLGLWVVYRTVALHRNEAPTFNLGLRDDRIEIEVFDTLKTRREKQRMRDLESVPIVRNPFQTR